jgi:hypothetical protein
MTPPKDKRPVDVTARWVDCSHQRQTRGAASFAECELLNVLMAGFGRSGSRAAGKTLPRFLDCGRDKLSAFSRLDGRGHGTA